MVTLADLIPQTGRGTWAGLILKRVIAVSSKPPREMVSANGRRFLSGLLLGLVAGLALLTAIALLPKAFGYTPLVVLSGSMEPTLHTGDIVVTKKIARQDVRLGDVITYRGEPGLVTHRIVGLDITPQGMFYQTKGDANLSEDPRPVPVEQIETKVIYRIPRVGFLVTFVGSPIGLLIMVAAPLVLLVTIWRGNRPVNSKPRSRRLPQALQRFVSSRRKCETRAGLIEEANASGTRRHVIRGKEAESENTRLIFRSVE